MVDDVVFDEAVILCVTTLIAHGSGLLDLASE